jgi:hypothetical protein
MILQSGDFFIKFSKWFFHQPVFAQILTTIGIFAIITMILVIVYYIIKSIHHLITKGIRGKKDEAEERSQKEEQRQSYPYISSREKALEMQPDQVEKGPPKEEIIVHYPKRVKYCSACGMVFSDKVKNILKKRGNAFCEYCGKVHKVMEQSVES